MWWWMLLVAVLQATTAAKQRGVGTPTTAQHHESVIEEVNAKQLERILQDKDYVAVFWCKWYHMFSVCF